MSLFRPIHRKASTADAPPQRQVLTRLADGLKETLTNNIPNEITQRIFKRSFSSYRDVLICTMRAAFWARYIIVNVPPTLGEDLWKDKVIEVSEQYLDSDVRNRYFLNELGLFPNKETRVPNKETLVLKLFSDFMAPLQVIRRLILECKFDEKKIPEHADAFAVILNHTLAERTNLIESSSKPETSEVAYSLFCSPDAVDIRDVLDKPGEKFEMIQFLRYLSNDDLEDLYITLAHYSFSGPDGLGFNWVDRLIKNKVIKYKYSDDPFQNGIFYETLATSNNTDVLNYLIEIVKSQDVSLNPVLLNARNPKISNSVRALRDAMMMSSMLTTRGKNLSSAQDIESDPFYKMLFEFNTYVIDTLRPLNENEYPYELPKLQRYETRFRESELFVQMYWNSQNIVAQITRETGHIVFNNFNTHVISEYMLENFGMLNVEDFTDVFDNLARFSSAYDIVAEDEDYDLQEYPNPYDCFLYTYYSREEEVEEEEVEEEEVEEEEVEEDAMKFRQICKRLMKHTCRDPDEDEQTYTLLECVIFGACDNNNVDLFMAIYGALDMHKYTLENISRDIEGDALIALRMFGLFVIQHILLKNNFKTFLEKICNKVNEENTNIEKFGHQKIGKLFDLGLKRWIEPGWKFSLLFQRSYGEYRLGLNETLKWCVEYMWLPSFRYAHNSAEPDIDECNRVTLDAFELLHTLAKYGDSDPETISGENPSFTWLLEKLNKALPGDKVLKYEFADVEHEDKSDAYVDFADKRYVTFYAVEGTIKSLTEKNFTRSIYNTMCGIHGFEDAFKTMFTNETETKIRTHFIVKSSYAFLLDLIKRSQAQLTIAVIKSAYESDTSMDLHHVSIHNKTPIKRVELHRQFLENIFRFIPEGIISRYDEIVLERRGHQQEEMHRYIKFRSDYEVNDEELSKEEDEYYFFANNGVKYTL